MPNQLIHATSPYLLQHANNPVDWYPWGETALARARAEEKPIFLSIGYAACHWCHVMAHESFEDPQIAALLNANFINIKVDREQRPDLDSLYMAATVAMTGSGGWPMSVFLTPDLRPFYAGTYFPPAPRYNQPSFGSLLKDIINAWQHNRAEIARVGNQVTKHLQRQNLPAASGVIFSQALLQNAAENLHQTYDWGFGGWGEAPKFPQPMTIEFLLRRSHQSPRLAEAAQHALQSMARGGMYDVVGGGFARYSTDNRWLAPHFEKMLSDNALLAHAYLAAYQRSRTPFYARIAQETLAFIERELTHPQGGFFSSLDADSPDGEGSFYTWKAEEIKAALGGDWEFFRAAYAISSAGNWNGQMLLQRALDDATLMTRFHLTQAELNAKLTDCHRRLLAQRETRPRPACDDKILTAWNGLTLSAFAYAAQVFSALPVDEENANPNQSLARHYLDLATRNANFLLTALRPAGQLQRAWRNGQATTTAFLEDYAALLLGLLDLYEADFNPRWFNAANDLANEMIALFADPAGGFFDTPVNGEHLLMRPKDLQDNATPCGNSLAVAGLLRLSALSDKSEYRLHAENALPLVAENAIRYPGAYACWLSGADFALAQVKQVALLGAENDPEIKKMLAVLRENYQPNQVIAVSSLPLPSGAPPLLENRPQIKAQASAYLCQGFTCQTPVTSADALRQALI